MTPFKELPGDIFNNPTTLSSQILNVTSYKALK